MLARIICFSSALFCFVTLYAQHACDVQRYQLEITLSDTSDIIEGRATLRLCVDQSADDVRLDLVGLSTNGTGMAVSQVLCDGHPLQFRQNADTLIFEACASVCQEYVIDYRGVPGDGLIISQNLFDDRTFFGDNWPNRARHWFPCNDHPSDKAFFEFIVTAPDHYQVVACGTLVEETDLANGQRLTHWETAVQLPTKVAVIGVARFAVQYLGDVHDIPVSSWVYPQNRVEGFYDYALAAKVLDYFIEHVGDYPFQKIANVQSRTRFGGMENASNIFYFEASVTGKRRHESLIAHEIAHQWFGNSATESDWPHIWLSEGFATYMTNLYIEHTQGRDSLSKSISGMRRTIVQFSKRQMTPVVDFETTNYMQLLNANSYQKGAFVLHMLRRKLGDDIFWRTIRTYYDRFQLSNATTEDFQNIAEEVSGLELDQFFQQWLLTAGHPVISIKQKIVDSKLQITITQHSDHIFAFPLDLQWSINGFPRLQTVAIDKKVNVFTFDDTSIPKDLMIDPYHWLLFELTSKN